MISLQLILDIIILLGLGTVITLLLRNGLQKKSSSETEDDPNKLDIKELKQSIDNQITTMSASLIASFILILTTFNVSSWSLKAV